MKIQLSPKHCFLLLLVGLCPAVAATGSQPLTAREAEGIISRRMTEKAERAEARKRELKSVEVLQRRVTHQGERIVIVNRLAPRPTIRRSSQSAPPERRRDSIRLREPVPEKQATSLQQESLTLSITAFDHAISRIVWKEQKEPRRKFEVWANLDLSVLPAFNTFEWEDVSYNCMLFINSIKREEETRREMAAAESGTRYESRWEPAPTDFSPGVPEYVVLTLENEEVPRELYRQMDALLSYVLQNQETLKTDYERRMALSAAREKYLLEHPAELEPKETIINYWPVIVEGEDRK